MMTAAVGFGSARTAYGWRRGVAYVLLWSTVVFALENFVPVSSLAPEATVLLVLKGAPGHLFAGASFVVFAAFAVPRLSSPQLLLATAGVAVFITLIRTAARDPFVSFEKLLQSNIAPHAHSHAHANASAIYLAWGTLLYGGLFVAASALAHRAERTLALLGRAEIARSRSETLFSQAQLAGLQGSVDPSFLLRALDEMQQRYASAPAGADRLLDQLVGFLRLAMPGVRSGRSTLGAELAVTRSYAQLAHELDAQRPALHCDIDGALAELPFPPLLLLPLLDQLAAAQGGPTALTMTALRAGSQLTLALYGQAAPGWLAEDLLYRLRVGLRATHGDARVTMAETETQAAGLPALTMMLPLAIPSPCAKTAQPLYPDPGASPPWTSQSTPTT